MIYLHEFLTCGELSPPETPDSCVNWPGQYAFEHRQEAIFIWLILLSWYSCYIMKSVTCLEIRDPQCSTVRGGGDKSCREGGSLKNIAPPPLAIISDQTLI